MKFMMLVGLPGSGKSTWARKMAEQDNTIKICSSDEIRREIFGDVNNQDNNTEVFTILHQRIKQYLREGYNVIYDATNIIMKRRMAFLGELDGIDCTKYAYIFATPYERCLRNNWMRERKVPDGVIRRMYMTWQTPGYFEGWDYIKVIDELADLNRMPDLNDYDQNNPHHKDTLGVHMNNVYLSVSERIINGALWHAALFHDIGKPFTRFEDEDGISHYCNHENVGAYDALASYGLSLNASLLINYHMLPFQWESEKIRQKWHNIFGEDLYNYLLILHEADVAN